MTVCAISERRTRQRAALKAHVPVNAADAAVERLAGMINFLDRAPVPFCMLVVLVYFRNFLFFLASADQVLRMALREQILFSIQELVLLYWIELQGGVSEHPKAVLLLLQHLLS